jgi:ankyrin repeat protein
MVLLGFYKLLLERESFFVANRFYLLGCLVLACVIPFIALPKLSPYQGVASGIMEPLAEQRSGSASVALTDESAETEETNDTDPDLAGRQELTTVKDNDQSVNERKNQIADKPVQKPAEGSSMQGYFADRGFTFWLALVYGFGVVVLLIKLLAQVFSTLRTGLKSQDKIADEDGIIVNLQGAVDPCSFFRYIFINPASYDFETYEQIIAHEKIHVKQLHSLDLLLSELAVVLLWFNPFIWILRREVEKNIEYQTDDSLVRHSSGMKESYQLNLVKIASYSQPMAITTNYNQSLIKQRILKMNNKRSNNYGYWKYTFLAPLIFGLILFLNKPNISYGQEEQAVPLEKPEVVNSLPAPEPEVPEEEVPVSESPGLADDCGALTQAVLDENVSEVRRLLKTVGPDCVDPDPGYITRIVNGWTYRESEPRTPLAAAANRGNLEIAQLLVAAGATVDFDAGDYGWALTEAASEGHSDFVAYLLENGADVNRRSNGQGSPLNAAARGGHVAIAKMLLAEGAEINFQNDGQGSALNAAARNGHKDMVSYLLDNGAEINGWNDGQGSALNAAARNGHDEVVALLIEKGANVNAQSAGQGSALNAAARNGHTSTLTLLLSKGADINLQNNGQGSALNAAARNGHDEAVALLIDKGADVDRRSDGQGTALNAAARNGHLSTIELLLEKGADIDRGGDGQGSALNAAARNGHVEVIKLLLDKGADIDRQTDGQGTALNAAARNGHDQTVALLIERGADVNRQNDGQGSALNAAARNGHISTAALLLEKGARVDQQNDGQGSALNAAARNGHYDMVELLISKGADVNRQNDGQGSALNAAARNGHLEVVKLLVSKGADVNQYSDGQGSALSAASRNRHRAVVKYLISEGAEY